MKHPVRLMALALILLFSVLAVAPSGADENRDVVHELRTQRDGFPSSEGRRTQSSATYTPQATSDACWTDPGSDTMNASTGGTEAYPKADIVQWCATFQSDSIVVKTRAATPTSPSSDPNWVHGMSGAAWGLDFNGDNQDEYAVYLFNTGSGVVSSVQRSSDDQEMCSGTPHFDGTYVISTFSTSCVGNPTTLYVEAFYMYDSEWNNEFAPIYADISDIYGGPVQSSPPPSSPSEPQPAPAPSGSSKYFSDVVQNPHAANIDYMYERGLVNGCATNPLRFCPGNGLTRAQFATVMAEYIRSQP